MTAALIPWLIAASALLLSAVLLWRSARRSRALQQAARELKRIQDAGSDEKLMLMSDDKALCALLAQTDQLLVDRQRLRVDYLRAQQAQKQMISNISHDIKTPLTVILGYLEMARLRDEQGQTLEKVERKAHQMAALLDQFFVLAKLEAGDTPEEAQCVNLSELCRETAVEFYDSLNREQMEVEVEIPAEDLFVWGSETALRRILGNLISNALRYGASGRYLGIQMLCDERRVLVRVRDRGAGMEPEQLRHIFDRLYTLDDARGRGSGLGLAIARTLAEQMDGTLEAESVPGRGTVFTLNLPRAKNERKS